MTQQDIITLCKSSRFPNTGIPAEADKFIKANFTQVDRDAKGDGTWHKVYSENADCKYGAYMVEPEQGLWRHTDFFEFYGGAVID